MLVMSPVAVMRLCSPTEKVSAVPEIEIVLSKSPAFSTSYAALVRPKAVPATEAEMSIQYPPPELGVVHAGTVPDTEST